MKANLRQKFTLLLFGVIFSLCLGEIIVRVMSAVLPPPPHAYWQADPDCGYRLHAGTPVTNNPNHPEFINTLGFRDRQRSLEKPEGTFRILGLGDSFVYGAVPPEQNFLRVAENDLNAAPDSPPVDIPMLGCPGWSVENELGLLRTLGLQMQPDLVLVNFFVGNDVTGIPVRGKVIQGDLHFSGSSRWWLGILRRSRLFMLTEKSLLVALRNKWVAKQYRSPASSDPAQDTEVVTPIVTPEFLFIQRRNIPVFANKTGRKLAGLWQEAEAQLLEVDAVCRAAGVPWLLVVIPTEIQVDDEVRSRILAGLDLPASDYDFELPQRKLRDIAAQHGIALLDLLPSLRQAHTLTAPLYVPNNTHWNERGNDLVGHLLARRIRQMQGGSVRTPGHKK